MEVHSYKKYGIIKPYQQALKYNHLGGMTCCSYGEPVWSYNNHYDFFATHGNYTIPHSMTIGKSLLITKSKTKATQYFCEGTYPNSTTFTAEAFIFRGGE